MSLDEPVPVTRTAAILGIAAAVSYLVIAFWIFLLQPDEAWLASPPFVLAHSLALAILSALVSFMLYSHSVRTGNTGYLMLAGAFASVVVFMGVFPLTFPGAVRPVTEASPGGITGSPQSSIATFFTWHLVLYAALPLAVVFITRGARRRRTRVGLSRIALSLLAWVGGALTFCVVAIVFPSALPTLVSAAGTITPLSVVIGWLLFGLAVAGLILVAVITRARSPISRWILAVLVLSIGEAIVAVGSERYSIGWYFNRAFGIAALTFLVIALAWEIARADQPTLRTTSYDALTQTMTRSTFERTLEWMMAETQPRKLALLWINLDDFNGVNARLGHQSADAVLREVAQRLQSQLGPQDLIARVGGDEFAVALFGPRAGLDAEGTALQLVREVARPMELGEGSSASRVLITCSVGVVVAAQGSAILDLSRNAELAMREAKSRGGNRFARYLPGLGESERRHAELRLAIQDAITAGEFVPFVQPVVDVGTKEIVGFEVLARWQGTDTRIAMSHVITVAESSRLIIPIGEQVRAVMAPVLPKLFEAHPKLRFVSLNLAVPELTDGRAVASLLEPPWLEFSDRLVIEITEGAALYATDANLSSLETLREAGYRLAVDDYGVGFSTIARLEQLGASIVKSDSSLITRRPQTSAEPRDLIQVAYDVARAVKGTLIVEGVETEREEELVRELVSATPTSGSAGEATTPSGGEMDGVPVFAQGYLYGRPAPLADWLRAEQSVG